MVQNYCTALYSFHSIINKSSEAFSCLLKFLYMFCCGANFLIWFFIQQFPKNNNNNRMPSVNIIEVWSSSLLPKDFKMSLFQAHHPLEGMMLGLQASWCMEPCPPLTWVMVLTWSRTTGVELGWRISESQVSSGETTGEVLQLLCAQWQNRGVAVIGTALVTLQINQPPTDQN